MSNRNAAEETGNTNGFNYSHSSFEEEHDKIRETLADCSYKTQHNLVSLPLSSLLYMLDLKYLYKSKIKPYLHLKTT
jgi:hypothetical protein